VAYVSLITEGQFHVAANRTAPTRGKVEAVSLARLYAEGGRPGTGSQPNQSPSISRGLDFCLRWRREVDGDVGRTADDPRATVGVGLAPVGQVLP
jgi:hypothetical protein